MMNGLRMGWMLLVVCMAGIAGAETVMVTTADDNGDRDGGVPDLGEGWGEATINWKNAPGHDAVDVAAGAWFANNPPVTASTTA